MTVSVQYLELSIISILAGLAIFIPYAVTLLGLKNSRQQFRELSKKDILLFSIVIGEMAIIVPTTTIGFANFVHIGDIFYVITIASIIVASAILIKSRILSVNIFQQLKHYLKQPEYLFIIALLLFYSYLVLIIPVELSYDTANYYLPYSLGLLKNGFIPSDPILSYTTLGGQPALTPGVSAIYAYSLKIIPFTDSFKLLPILFAIHLCISISLLAKEIYPRIRRSWVIIITLISPPMFFYLTTAPYNADLLFSAFFITAILGVIKSKKSSSILWTILAGASACGMVLTKDAGLLFLLPIFSLVLLGHRQIGKFWIAPFALQLLVPISFLLNSTLSDFFVEHSTSLIVIQVVSLAILYYFSRSYRAEYNTRIIPFALMFVPAVIFVIMMTGIWGSPIIRTYAGFFITPGSAVDYPWASNIALKGLGEAAFPIKPQNFQNMFFNIGYIFVAPALGGLLFVPRIATILRNFRRQSGQVLLPIVLIIVVVNWICVFAGINYNDQSTFRHTLDVIAIMSVLTVIGISSIINEGDSHNRLKFLIIAAIIFATYVLTYFEYNSTLFSLKSRIISQEPFLQYIVYSIAIFASIFSVQKINFNFLTKIAPYLLKGAIAVILLGAVIPYIAGTMQVIATNNGSYEETNRQNLSSLSFGPATLAVHDYFKGRNMEGRILAYGIDWFSYRTGLEVLKMETIIDLAVLKNTLTGNDTASVVTKLKDMDIQYIVTPVSGGAYERFRSLYNETRIFEVLTPEYTTQQAKYGNLAIYQIR
ncbi:glycosyltransferase family protein [Nitrososphaera viennensis]|uniref:Uncharacterized protein n=2 Tax=Nitrososphaera viennensis TaxID=1034015 RepID=A0A060HLV0_9ARCH|nr:hypothetical protein [Nitrososphaera viennensis]AIC16433.1 membrane protein of unknown function [Nitrososphaera viennensis EN76]UVS68368.1 glycosyltransferase family 39 protein [Nitrososphaera viennensis]